MSVAVQVTTEHVYLCIFVTVNFRKFKQANISYLSNSHQQLHGDYSYETQTQGAALCQGGFVSKTPHIPNQMSPLPFPKGALLRAATALHIQPVYTQPQRRSCSRSHHTPFPLAFMVDLYSARALITSIHQSDRYMKHI